MDTFVADNSSRNNKHQTLLGYGLITHQHLLPNSKVFYHSRILV